MGGVENPSEHLGRNWLREELRPNVAPLMDGPVDSALFFLRKRTRIHGLGHFNCTIGPIVQSEPMLLPEEVVSVLRSWFGPSAGIAACTLDPDYPLFPEEEACIRSAVPRRRAEFAAGRWCARRSLAELGYPVTPILVGHLREPLWPSGAIGTITHTETLSAAVVARSDSWSGIGIDLLEVAAAGRILGEVDGLISDSEEERCAEALVGANARALLFSAKESVIKAISHRLQRFVDFREIVVTLEDGIFEASSPGKPRVDGWWHHTEDMTLTGAVLALKS